MANKIPTGRTLFQVQYCEAQALITLGQKEVRLSPVLLCAL